MLNSSDFIKLKYSPDLTQAGIAYTCRSFSQSSNRRSDTRFVRIRQNIANLAVEIAFRRYLADREIPHALIKKKPISDPDFYKVTLGGRICHIECDVITSKKRIREIRQDPETLLSLQVHEPNNNLQKEFDIYIFSVLTALLTPDAQSLNRAIEAKQPIYLIRPFPKIWSRPKLWTPFKSLTLISKATEVVTVMIGGQNEKRVFQMEELHLNPGQLTEVENEFFSISYMVVDRLPDGPISISCPNIKNPLSLHPSHWGNIWVYGMDIIFVGYIPCQHFSTRAMRLSSEPNNISCSKLLGTNLRLPISALDPLPKLFSRAKLWNPSEPD